jgi:hypothetical protein
MANIDRRTTEAFFNKKVPGSVMSEGGRHTAYRIFAPGGRLLLGNLTFSRGASGEELDLRNLKGLAADMGLSLEGFVEASSCRIRPEAVVLCIASRILEDAAEMYRLDPISFDHVLVKSLGVAIDEWIALVSPGDSRKLSSKEIKEVDRCIRRLEAIGAQEAFRAITLRYLQRAGELPRG